MQRCVSPCSVDPQLSNMYTEPNPVNINGTINVWIHAHTHDDPGWLVKADQYYVKVVPIRCIYT